MGSLGCEQLLGRERAEAWQEADPDDEKEVPSARDSSQDIWNGGLPGVGQLACARTYSPLLPHP